MSQKTNVSDGAWILVLFGGRVRQRDALMEVVAKYGPGVKKVVREDEVVLKSGERILIRSAKTESDGDRLRGIRVQSIQYLPTMRACHPYCVKIASFLNTKDTFAYSGGTGPSAHQQHRGARR